jgi:hemerythrin
MAFIDWSDKLATGIPSIDDQHKRLIGIVNELHGAMRKGKGRELIQKTLKELLGYTDYHFANEERAFDAYGYPSAAEHKKQHSLLIKQLGEQYVKLQRNEISLTVSTLEFLSNWVSNHIMLEDMKYVPFLKDKHID